MKRIVIQKPDEVTTEEVPDPRPGTGEVSIAVAYCGICGSDLHAFRGRHPFIPLPATPGHEFSGVIEAVGDGVGNFIPGDRVVCEPLISCGTCYNCVQGRYNICTGLKVVGCQGEGAMADCFIAPAATVQKIPDSLSLRDAALVEPLAVGIHAAKRGGNLMGSNVVIIGAGTIGLMVLHAVLRGGARRVVVTDLVDERLSRASDIGATKTVNAGHRDAQAQVLDGIPESGIDAVFECVGVEQGIENAIRYVRKGGRIVVAGVFENRISISIADVQDREIELVGTLVYTRRDFTEAVEMLASGEVNGNDFVNEVYGLEDAERAFKAAMNTATNIKVLFGINPE
jgi:L-iditol 2-dehydrogenase